MGDYREERWAIQGEVEVDMLQYNYMGGGHTYRSNHINKIQC